VTREEEWENCRVYLQLHAHESDEAAMARFRREHPEFVHAEMEFYAATDANKKKQASVAEAEAGPSTVDISSSDDAFLEVLGASD
jgi:hypothetical protein